MGNYFGKEPLATPLVRDYFAGNGSQTVFTLTYNAVHNYGVIVSLSGIIQVPGDAYTITGTTLTFTEAPGVPPAGVVNNIEVIYLVVGNYAITSNYNVPYANATNSGDVITATYTPAPTNPYTDNLSLGFTISTPNTTATPTLNANGIGAKTIVKANGARLLPGDLSLEHWVVYNSTLDKFVLLNPTRGYVNGFGLTNLLYPSNTMGWRDVLISGWTPAFMNQQWGGAPMPFELVDNGTSSYIKFDSATGYIDDQASMLNIANATGQTWVSQGFKVSKSLSAGAVWVKVAKSGSPTNNLELRILPDDGTGKPSGSTPITNGTATALSGKLFNQDPAAQWFRFTFSTPPALTVNTQYHLTMKSSGAVDASNFWLWKGRTAGKTYPHGNVCIADGTPTWTTQAGFGGCFIVEPQASDQMLQTGGQFESKLIFNEGSPLNQSNVLTQPLSNFFDDKECSFLVRGSGFTKDKTICDFLYGLDHDRIVVRSNVTTGFAEVDVYDSAGNKRTVTATSVDTSSGYHEISVHIASNNSAGTDRIDLFVDGVANGAAFTGTAISFDPNMKLLGTAWMGGGFNLAPAWTQKLAFGVLPSADSPSWTWTGAATEANAVSVAGNRLYQNKNGYTSAQDGYYSKASLSLSNTNGWAVATRVRASFNTNTKDAGGIEIEVADGTKVTSCGVQEYYSEFINNTFTSAATYYQQQDNKTYENVVLLIGKGADVIHFVNGKVSIDATTQMTTTSANNRIQFGDSSVTAGENADAVWRYFAYYNTASTFPQVTSGSLSEFSFWSGDQRPVFVTLYNNGSPVSVKQFAGEERGWALREIVQRVGVSGITANPTTTSTASPPTTVLNEMEIYIIGSNVNFAKARATAANSADQAGVGIGPELDGVVFDRDMTSLSVSGAGGSGGLEVSVSKDTYFGLHKCNITWSVTGTTGTATNARRRLEVEAKTT